MRTLLVFCAYLLCASAVLATPSETEDDFARANSIFEASVTLLGSNNASATGGLRQSAEMYEIIVDKHDVQSSDLLTNAGNARLLAGDTGHAIALYHRALRLDPSDANARANLAVARQRASADAAIERSSGALDTLTAWRRAIPAHVRVVITLTAWGVLWMWGALRLLGVRAGTWTLTALPMVIVMSIGGLTLAADAAASAGAPPIGVVVVSESVGRTGPDEVAYDPSFTKPLPEGAEFIALDERAGWVRGRLGDGRETWVRTGDVEIVGN